MAQANDFIELCTELRKLGATSVEHGAFKATFAGALPSVRDTKPQREPTAEQRRRALEQARLDELNRV